jgi:hypothetical protein
MTVEVAKKAFNPDLFTKLLNEEIAKALKVEEVTTMLKQTELADRIVLDVTATVKSKEAIDKNKLLDVLKYAIPSVCALLGLKLITSPEAGERLTGLGLIVIIILILGLLVAREVKK